MKIEVGRSVTHSPRRRTYRCAALIQDQQLCLSPCCPCASWDSSPSHPPVTSRTAPEEGNERCRRLGSDSACRVAPETGAAASAPVSAAGRASVVCSAPRKRLTAWRRTTCSPPARQEGDPVDLREDAALLQDSAVTLRAVRWTLTAWGRPRPQIQPTALQGARQLSCCCACCMWPPEDRMILLCVEVPLLLRAWRCNRIKIIPVPLQALRCKP